MSFSESLEAFGHLFYVVTPNKTTFDTVDDVPDYFEQNYPDIAVLFALEVIISFFFRKSKVRINDTISNISQSILFHSTEIIAPGGQLALYIYVYSKWKIVNLPSNDLSTWWISFFASDFLYYCLHRAAHEINILWALHEVHHSSEEYNIAVNIRQSLLQKFITSVTSLPLALFIPPTQFMVHGQFTGLYQFWIHTEVVRSLGPLEYILVTPSHHRVHHGANKNFIDKNFGGTLIIWDKLFGTFATEYEPVVYGLTEPVRTFNPISIQFNHPIKMWKMFWTVDGLWNKLSVLFKGPGWAPGKPRLGDPADIPTKPTIEKYNPRLPLFWNIYIVWHFFLIYQGYYTLMKNYEILQSATLYGTLMYIVLSVVTFGLILDRRIYSSWMECLRCAVFFVVQYYLQRNARFSLIDLHARWVPETVVYSSLAISLIFWILYHSLYFDIEMLTASKKKI